MTDDKQPDPVPIPKAVRDLLGRAWLENDAEHWWRHHRDSDLERGQIYWWCREQLHGYSGFETYTASEVRKLVKARAVPESLTRDRGQTVGLNQHASNSLQQCLHECGMAYARHLERMRRWEPQCAEHQHPCAVCEDEAELHSRRQT